MQAWLPALDGVTAKLEAGAKVADVGCGYGASTIILAQAFPASQFWGFDYHEGSIDAARKAAAEAGVADRVTFVVASGHDYPGTDFDLVCHFDCLHDMGDPVGAAAHTRRSLKPDGTLAARRALRQRRRRRQPQPRGPRLLLRLHADLHARLEVAGRRRRPRCPGR